MSQGYLGLLLMIIQLNFNMKWMTHMQHQKKVIDGIKPFISKSINLLIIIPESFGMISGL